jgi:hypothetical protein
VRIIYDNGILHFCLSAFPAPQDCVVDTGSTMPYIWLANMRDVKQKNTHDAKKNRSQGRKFRAFLELSGKKNRTVQGNTRMSIDV